MSEISKLVSDALDPGPRQVTGAELKALRTRAGVTQATMAALIGVSRPAYANWELGRHEPARKHWKRASELADEMDTQLKARGK